MAHRTWDAFHRRGDVLRAVADRADARRDGVLPLDVLGLAETFPDQLDLIAALQLRWHTRLAGRIEQALTARPNDRESAVLAAWRTTANELAGVRLVLDRALAEPPNSEVTTAMRRAQQKEWALLAAMAGRAGVSDPAAPRIGRALEERARIAFHPTLRPRGETGAGSLIGRIRAVLAA
ncbi:MAG TPA: hypothetical protein VFH10_03505 [Nocardioides sp.]|uniref:hypothetical protein n=1 Tax=Nocardioides sp. TaxID=35761 RepID=UPI002D8112B6|nr:hypothetical protein [Nocardioides sp.]HET6651682.1 hypothetical protein [Nocardioides sp.]